MTLSEDDVDIAVRIVKRLMTKGVLGGHHKQPQSVAGWFPSDEQGRVKQVLDDMGSDPTVPVHVYGGRDTVQLTNMDAALQFLEKHGAEDPRGW